jgi:NAD(P) transhydrogenase subunit alpha
MRIGIPAETRPGETRVAATPETVKKLAAKHQVIVQSGAGLKASVIDDAYVAAGATIGSAADALAPRSCSRYARPTRPNGRR